MKYTAGRFAVEFDHHRIELIELHRNGSGEEMARLTIDGEKDLPDVLHILRRVEADFAKGSDLQAMRRLAEVIEQQTKAAVTRRYR